VLIPADDRAHRRFRTLRSPNTIRATDAHRAVAIDLYQDLRGLLVKE
jgi:hypothetical protein